ncbi:outer membrane protein assembly factor BamD [Candidatus Dependentiae bacterium]|nr:outer membrane protein assembly factor BamD [Candidatus Dependentiae bacterium]
MENSKKYFLGFFIFSIILLLPNCAKQDEKKVEDMNFDEIKQKTLSALEQHKNEHAISYLEKLIAQHPDNKEISKYKLILADLYFEGGNLPSAFELYKHFTEFYPSDPKAEFASYRAILSKFYQTLKPHCDQTETQDTIRLCDGYLKKTNFYKYKNDVQDIINTCEQKLIDKEVYVYNFYLKKGNYKAAKNRLDYLKNTYLEKKPSLEARLLFLESKLANKQKDNKIVEQKIEILLNKYPDSHFTKMAQRLVNQGTFIF